jgi:hypothetical protein
MGFRILDLSGEQHESLICTVLRVDEPHLDPTLTLAICHKQQIDADLQSKRVAVRLDVFYERETSGFKLTFLCSETPKTSSNPRQKKTGFQCFPLS